MKTDYCAACSAADDLEHHHIIPRSIGGSDDETNVVTLCRACHCGLHGLAFSPDHKTLTRLGLQRAKAEGRTTKRLTELQRRAIRADQKAGATFDELMEIYGCGRDAIRLALRRQPRKAVDHDAVIADRLAGMTIQETKRKHDCTGRTIAKIWAKYRKATGTPAYPAGRRAPASTEKAA